jgi:alkylation response protein AidB-like acyl-CoA dehydrogenase
MSILSLPARTAPASHAHAALPPLAASAELEALSERFAAGAEALDRSGAFPHDNLATLHAHGLVGAVVPRAAGGSAATLAQARRIVAAVARGEPSTALVLTMTYLIHRSIARGDSRWSPHLRDAVWRSAVERGALANNLRVEPELGSPARGGLPATVARRTADGWLLSGHKLYTTGIPGLSWLAVWGRTDEPEPRVGIFLVPRQPGLDVPGLRIVESWDHLGLRASGSHEVLFEDVALPLDHAVDLRPPGEWAAGPDADQYAWMIVLLGALYDGVARAARNWLVRFLEERRPGSLGAPLSSVPRVQQVVGEIEALLWANDALLGDLVLRTDAGTPPSAIDSGLVKFNVTGNAIRVVELALQLTGNHGLSRHNPLERHWRDVLCSRIHTPQNDSILVSAGLAAFAAR